MTHFDSLEIYSQMGKSRTGIVDLAFTDSLLDRGRLKTCALIPCLDLAANGTFFGPSESAQE